MKQRFHFHLVSIGTALFVIIFLLEFSLNQGVLSTYSTAMLFVVLIILLVLLLVLSILYTKQYADLKGKILLGIILLTGSIFLFFLITNVLVMV